MDQIIQTLEPVRQFSKDSVRLVKRCTKPDRKGKYKSNFWRKPAKVIYFTLLWGDLLFRNFGLYIIMHLNYVSEFQKIAVATAIGFAIMGFIGFFVKLIHIPINNIIVGS